MYCYFYVQIPKGNNFFSLFIEYFPFIEFNLFVQKKKKKKPVIKGGKVRLRPWLSGRVQILGSFSCLTHTGGIQNESLPNTQILILLYIIPFSTGLSLPIKFKTSRTVNIFVCLFLFFKTWFLGIALELCRSGWP